MSDAPSTIAGRYRVGAMLGRGGMGVVYDVTDVPTGRRLALKKQLDPRHALRFLREFHTMARLRHPSIVEVYDFGTDDVDGLPFYTMELLDGQDLKRAGRLAPVDACRVLRDVAGALAFLHSRRWVHRDVAAANVRSTKSGRAKLIDFGLLATPGLVGDVAGTPPSLAPECVRGLPLDHRADLFGLGALAYFVLTGRHAYPAKSIDDLENAWARRPPPPSRYAHDVSPLLDELVLSLLSHDRAQRPASAAETIDRLNAAGGLEAEPDIEVARGYLTSAAIVGRERELGFLRRRVSAVGRRRGRCVLVEAPSGAGKTRLLLELGLEAQVAGAIVVSVGARSTHAGPYSLAREIVRALLVAAPDLAQSTASTRVASLARIVPEIAERISRSSPIRDAPLGESDPGEERVRAQGETVAWLLEIARRRPLVIIVDDAHRADDASATLLAALARAARRESVLLALAIRTDEPAAAPASLAAMRDSGVRLRVRGLDEKAVQTLVRELFGDVPHAPRLAHHLQRASGGSPLLCMELVRHFVDRGVVRYVDGEWMVPEDLPADATPRRLDEAMDARVASLRVPIRELAQALSVHAGAISLELAVELASGASEAAIFAILDELTFEEILVGSGERYRFRHDGIREALVRSISEGARVRLHWQIAEALSRQARGEIGPELEAEVGWHYLHGGDARRGGRLLERAGRRFFEAQSFRDAIAPLEAALDVYERTGARVDACLRIRYELVVCGCIANRSVAVRYVRPTIEAYRWHAGIHVAERAGKLLGRHLGLLAALVWASATRLLRSRRRRGPSPLEALRSFFVLSGWATTLFAATLEIAPVRSIVHMLEPLAIFPQRVPYAIYQHSKNVLLMALGRFGEGKVGAARVIDILERDRVTPIHEMDRRMGEGGARFVLALTSHVAHASETEALIGRLERLNLRFFDIAALQVRILHHRSRAEEDKARELVGRLDELSIPYGSVWPFETLSLMLCTAHICLVGDVVAIKRSVEQLSRLCADGYPLEPLLELARGAYHRERGAYQAAKSAYRHALAMLDPEEAAFRQWMLAALARTQLLAGDDADAIATAEQALALATDRVTAQLSVEIDARRTLAIALARGGQGERAKTVLAAGEQHQEISRCAFLDGILHDARARVAAIEKDPIAYEWHRVEVERLWRETRHPTLIARVPKPLAERGENVADDAWPVSEVMTVPEVVAVRTRSALETSASSRDASRDALTSMLESCSGPSERAARALEMLLDATSGARGWLFLARGGALALAASIPDEPPTTEVVDAVHGALESTQRGASRAVTATDTDTAAAPPRESTLRCIVLSTAHDRSLEHAIGAVAILQEGLPFESPDPAMIARMARILAGPVIREPEPAR